MSHRNKIALLVTLLAAAVIGCTPAWADRGYGHGGHGDGGWGWGLGLLLGTAILLEATQPAPAYYPATPYAMQPVYVQPPVVMTAPLTYSSLPPQAPPAPAEQAWWYFCNSSASYYPYVRNCPEGWTRVSPVPPGQ
jgi:hypothetical protein